MSKALKNLGKNTPYIKVAGRLCIAGILMAFLIATITAQASDRFSCILSQSSDGGQSSSLSCGSTGGNFIYNCSAGVCDAAGGEFNQYLADTQCANYAQSGCPETSIFGGGFISPVRDLY